MYGKGISREGSLLDVAVDLGIVKKSGAWFTYEGEQLGQGRENVKTFLSENVDLMVEISEKVKDASGIGDVDPLDLPAEEAEDVEESRQLTGRRARDERRWLPLGLACIGPDAVSVRGRSRPARTLAAVTGRFFVRTYGCQMNEHDSERIAGLLVADGMEPTDDLDAADVVVLNTCCIRENADNKLYGHLGRLKQLKESRPDLQIAVGGCLAQKDRELVRERAPSRRRGVRHPQPRARARPARHGPRSRARWSRSSRSTTRTRRRCRRGARSTTRPGSRSRSAATTRARSASCRRCAGARSAGALGDIVHEVEELARDGVVEVTLLGQNVNSYGRDLGAGQYRPQFADLLRAVDAVDGIERIRFTSPHPKDLRPDTIAAMAECASVCEHLHLPLQSGSDRTLARMHRGYTAARYLERLARGARRDRRPRGDDRHHRRASRARPSADFARDARGASRPRSTTRRTRSCSRPGRAPRPRP